MGYTETGTANITNTRDSDLPLYGQCKQKGQGIFTHRQDMIYGPLQSKNRG